MRLPAAQTSQHRQSQHELPGVIMILEQESIDVFLGLDVGKTGHHAVALNRAGKKLYDKALPQDETRIRDVLAKLAGHGKVLVVVDQPATIGALPVAVAQATGAAVGYLPGLAMRRIADLHPGQAKTDARDAAIIAEAARSMPHTLRSVELDDETLAELGVLCGFDDDLAGQITATSKPDPRVADPDPSSPGKGAGSASGPSGRRGSAHPLSDPAGVEDRRPRSCESTGGYDHIAVRRGYTVSFFSGSWTA